MGIPCTSLPRKEKGRYASKGTDKTKNTRFAALDNAVKTLYNYIGENWHKSSMNKENKEKT